MQNSLIIMLSRSFFICKKNQQYIIILLQNTKVTLNNKNMCTFTLMNKTSLHITSLSRTNRPTTSPEVRML